MRSLPPIPIGRIGRVGTGVSNRRFSMHDLCPELWLNASDLSTITEAAGAVSQWDDKSGNGNHVTQETGAYQPSTGSDTLNGRNVLTFDEDFLQLTDNVSFRTAVFVMDQVNGAGGTGAVFGSVSPSTGYYTFININASDGSYDISIDGSAGYTGEACANGTSFTSGANIDLGRTNAENEAPTIWAVRFDEAYYADYIGAFNTDAATKLIGNFAELVLFNRLLSDTEVNKIGNYLSKKWGIAWTDV